MIGRRGLKFILKEKKVSKTFQFNASNAYHSHAGLDYGGLSREMFVLLSTELFNSRDGYFIRFNLDNQQALVMPTVDIITL